MIRNILDHSPGKVISRTAIDIDRIGTTDTVKIELRSGRLVRDGKNWCGAGLKYVGTFELEVHLDGRVESFSLNKLFHTDSELWFRASPYEAGLPEQPVSWSILFDDYNGDGQPDFTLGQYGGCNGWYYHLFTISKTGEVEPMPFQCDCHRKLFLNEQKNSVRLKKTTSGFEVTYYNNATGRFRDRYRWMEIPGKFMLEGRQRIND